MYRTLKRLQKKTARIQAFISLIDFQLYKYEL